MYDIIGDVHGHHEALCALLERLGYVEREGAWRFPGGRRRALFVGDYIDRGPKIPETVDLIHAMVDAGSAEAILGNHEYNTLAWHTAGPDGRPLREHSEARRQQHLQTLLQYGADDNNVPSRFRSVLAWIAQLPMYYENCNLRAVHAVWDATQIATMTSDRPLIDDEFLLASSRHDQPEFRTVERLLKGVEVPLPKEAQYTDKDGETRGKTRVRWWLDYDEIARRYDGSVPLGEVAMPPVDQESSDTLIPTESLRGLPGYEDDRPVFFGHYWLTGTPRPFTPRVACLDYSVANGGVLCAYRFDGERELAADRYVCVAPTSSPPQNPSRDQQ